MFVGEIEPATPTCLPMLFFQQENVDLKYAPIYTSSLCVQVTMTKEILNITLEHKKLQHAQT